jgi:hypothetical protein
MIEVRQTTEFFASFSAFAGWNWVTPATHDRLVAV